MSTAATGGGPQVIVRAQTHRSRYYPGDTVRCNVHVHAQPVGRWGNASWGGGFSANSSHSNSSASGAVPGNASASRSKAPKADGASDAVHHAYDPERLYPDPLLMDAVTTSGAPSSSTSVAGATPSLSGTGVMLLSLSAQLICCCFSDETKLAEIVCESDDETNPEVMPSSKSTSSSLRLKSKAFVSGEGCGAHKRNSMSPECLEVVTAPDVCGRHEAFYLSHASNVARLHQPDPAAGVSGHGGRFLRYREPLTHAVLFALPSSLPFPSYRGHAFRSSCFIVVTAVWGLGGASLPSARTTHVRVPVRVGGVQYVLERPINRSHSLPEGLQSWLLQKDYLNDGIAGSHLPSSSSSAHQDGAFVQLPSRPSPAVCPPLDDELVRLTTVQPAAAEVTAHSGSNNGAVRHCMMSPNHQRSVSDALSTLGSSAAEDHQRRGQSSSAISPLASCDDVEVYRALTGLSKPTDFIIRYKDIHTMNLFIESSVMCIGGYFRGAFVHNLRGLMQAAPATLATKGHSDSLQPMRVGLITMTIEAYETTSRSLVRKGVDATEIRFPKYLFEDHDESATESKSSITTSASQAGEERVLLNTSVVEEREWFVYDVAQTPFEVCLSPTKYQQTLKTSLVSLEWMVKWKFWCVQADACMNANGAIGAPDGRRRLKDLYQELEVPILILPSPMGGNPRMGPATFGV